MIFLELFEDDKSKKYIAENVYIPKPGDKIKLTTGETGVCLGDDPKMASEGGYFAIKFDGKQYPPGTYDSVYFGKILPGSVNEGGYQSQFKSKEAAVAYAKDRARTFRDPDDGIEIWAMPDGGCDVVATMNSNGRNHTIQNGGKKLGTIGPRYQGVAEGDIPAQRNTDFKHRVSISYTNPNSPAVSQRKELQQKIILVPATRKDGTTLYQGEAEELARQWARRQGWRVKEINYVDFVKAKPKELPVDEGWFDKKPKEYSVGQIVKYDAKEDDGTPISGIGEITKVKPGTTYPYTINEKFAVNQEEILGIAKHGEYTYQGGWPVASEKPAEGMMDIFKAGQQPQKAAGPSSAEMRSYFAKEKASDPADISRNMKDVNKINQVYRKSDIEETDVEEGYQVVPGIDKERYQERPGLEGPYHTKSGKVVYYDKREGKYYDPDSDFYISHDDYQAMNEAGYVSKDSAQRAYDFSRKGFSRGQRGHDAGEAENKGVFTVEIDGRPWKTGGDNEMHQLAANTKRKYPNKQVVIVWPTGERNSVKEDMGRPTPPPGVPPVDKFGVPYGSRYYTPPPTGPGAPKPAEPKKGMFSSVKDLFGPMEEEAINELSNEKLAQYKTAAAADASRADRAGNFKRGDKRFSGINKATMKQFSNDAKK